MEGQKLFIDKARNGKRVKSVHKQIVCLLIIFVQTLCSEVEKLGHLSAFMVPPQHVNCRRKVQFQRVEQHHHFTGEGTSVHVVPQE
jgi:hypothetical protein